MRKLLSISLIAGLIGIVGIRCEEQQEQNRQCYQCTLFTLYIQCDTTIIDTFVEPLKCGWSEEDIKAYENKNFFKDTSKCSEIIQFCNCNLIKK